MMTNIHWVIISITDQYPRANEAMVDKRPENDEKPTYEHRYI